jgi:hypothetical protein
MSAPAVTLTRHITMRVDLVDVPDVPVITVRRGVRRAVSVIGRLLTLDYQRDERGVWQFDTLMVAGRRIDRTATAPEGIVGLRGLDSLPDWWRIQAVRRLDLLRAMDALA